MSSWISIDILLFLLDVLPFPLGNSKFFGLEKNLGVQT